MKPHSVRLLSAAATALFLTACASQNAAPVVDGTGSTTGGSAAGIYNPSTGGSAAGIYTPSTGGTTTPTDNGTYVPSGAATGGSTTTAPAASDNPYGAAPYTPGSTTGNNGTYVPSATQPASGNRYTGNYAPVDPNATFHTVVQGDTVYNISKRYGISQDTLRSLNGLQGNDIKIGQVLRISSNTTAPVPGTPPVATAPVQQPAAPAAPATNTPAASIQTAAAPTSNYGGLLWQSPLNGAKISKPFNQKTGIELSGTQGQPVVAAADGQVIFSGSGPRGYGNLIVVQHNPTYLSAYGNNESLLVSEKQLVKRGQTLASIGNSGTMTFEIREHAKSIDPSNIIHF